MKLHYRRAIFYGGVMAVVLPLGLALWAVVLGKLGLMVTFNADWLGRATFGFVIGYLYAFVPDKIPDK